MKSVLLAFFAIICIISVSCEGRKTQNQALKESVEEFKKTVNLEVDIYEPENYFEKEIDTLMYNGFRVKIKTYSDMDNSVLLFSKIKDTINYQSHYRNFKFDISVEKDGKLLYSESFDKEKVNQTLGYNTITNSKDPKHDFDKLAILKSIAIDKDLSTSDAILINLAYAIPKKSFIDWHKIRIDKNGKRDFITSK